MYNSINLNLQRLNFTSLAGFAQTIHDGYVAHAIVYPAPKPLMPVFQGDIDVFNSTISKWGVKGNRGSHTDYLALLAARDVVRNDLRRLSFYAQSVKPDDFVSWSDLGFKSKRSKS